MANGVDEEPGRLAHRQRRRWDGDFTLTTTALVPEAYLKLAAQRQLPTESREHFLALASRAMRHGHSTIKLTMDTYSYVLEGMQEAATDAMESAMTRGMTTRVG